MYLVEYPRWGLEYICGWKNCKQLLSLECARYHNRLHAMGDHRLPKQVQLSGFHWILKTQAKLQGTANCDDVSDSNINLASLEKDLMDTRCIELLHQMKLCSRLELLTEMCDVDLAFLQCGISSSNWLYLLETPLNAAQRNIVFNVLLGTLELEIETGRLKNLDRSKRLCAMCGSHVGDFKHLLFTCPTLQSERIDWLAEWDETPSPNYQLQIIEKLLRMPFVFVKYVQKLLNVRNSLLV